MQGILNKKNYGAPVGSCRTCPPCLHLQCSGGAATLVRKKGAGASVVRPTWEEAGFPQGQLKKNTIRPMPKVECSLNHSESGGGVGKGNTPWCGYQIGVGPTVTLSSKSTYLHPVNFGDAVLQGCSANLVTSPIKFWGQEASVHVLHRVEGNS